MIHHLHLRNFKKHENLEVNFTEGLNGVFGSNYAGKSTLLYGILYAIGGTSFVPGTQLIRRGSNAGMKAELKFSIEDEIYLVSRTKSTANLHCLTGPEPELLATGTTAVNEAMETRLGLPLKRFADLHYAEQKKAHTMLFKGAAELNSTLEELTGVATLSQALKHLAQMRSTMTAVLEEVPEVEETMPDVRAYEKKLGAASEVVNVCQLGSNEAGQILKDIKEKWAALNALRRQHAKYLEDSAEHKSSKGVLEAAIVDLKERIEEAESESVGVDRMATNLSNLEEKYYAKKQHLSNATGYCQKRKEVRDAQQALKAELEEVRTQLRDFKPCTEEDVQRLNDELVVASSRLDALNLLYRQADNSLATSSCGTCNRPFEGVDEDKLRATVEELSGKIDTAQHDYDEALTLHKQAANLWKTIDRAQQEHAGIFSRIESVTAELKNLPPVTEQDAVDLSLAVGKLKARIQTYRDEHAAAVVARELSERLTDKLEAKLSKLRVVEDALQDAIPPAFDEEEFASATTSRDAAEEHAGFVLGTLTNAENKLGSAQHDLHQAQTTANRIEEATAKRAEFEGKLSRVVQLTKFLKTNRDRYSTETWDYFMATASQFARSCTGGTIEGLARTEAGKFVFKENEYDMDLTEASGAQSAILGLGIQVALSAASQSGLDVLLVDEPTADMDAEHSMSTMALLASGRKQVIAISHQNMDSSLCTNVINL